VATEDEGSDVGEKCSKNDVTSKTGNCKCRKFSTLQKHEIKMQRKISVLQYYNADFEGVPTIYGYLVTNVKLKNCLEGTNIHVTHG